MATCRLPLYFLASSPCNRWKERLQSNSWYIIRKLCYKADLPIGSLVDCQSWCSRCLQRVRSELTRTRFALRASFFAVRRLQRACLLINNAIRGHTWYSALIGEPWSISRAGRSGWLDDSSGPHWIQSFVEGGGKARLTCSLQTFMKVVVTRCSEKYRYCSSSTFTTKY